MNIEKEEDWSLKGQWLGRCQTRSQSSGSEVLGKVPRGS